MDEFISDMMLFRGPTMIGILIILGCALFVGFRMAQKWFFHAILAAAFTVIALSVVLYVNHVYPDDVSRKEFSAENFVVFMIQQVARVIVNPFVGRIEKFVFGSSGIIF